jgi:hypothetical protein
VYLVAPTAVVGSPGRNREAPLTMRHGVVPLNCSRSSSGPVRSNARIWFKAFSRAWRAERSAVRRARIASTFPVLVFGSIVASPEITALAAAIASTGSDFP